MEMIQTTKWLRFVEIPTQGKTDRYEVMNKEDNKTVLGTIRWYSPFRQYSFFPEPNMVFEKTCMQDITDFMKGLMDKWSEQRKNPD